MKPLALLWNAVLCSRKEPLYSIRILAILNFIALGGTLVAGEMHHESLSSFFIGMSAAMSLLLISETLRLGSAEYKRDLHADSTIELRLSR